MSQDHCLSHIHLQALTPVEEDHIVDYMRQMAALGHPPTPALVLKVANALRDNRLLSDTVKIFPQINALTPSLACQVQGAS